MQLARLADTRNVEECRGVFSRLMKLTGLDEGLIKKALDIFDDVYCLYTGKYEGYKSCDTEYHDFRHVIDVTLASLRIADSLTLNGEKFSKNNIFLVGIAAVFHDTGYIPEISDPVENGAVYTSTHVRRSMVFAEKYMSEKGYSADDIEKTKQMILLTDLSVKLADITNTNTIHLNPSIPIIILLLILVLVFGDDDEMNDHQCHNPNNHNNNNHNPNNHSNSNTSSSSSTP